MLVIQGVALHLQRLYDPNLFSNRRVNPEIASYYKFEDEEENPGLKDEACSICLQKLSTIPLVEGWLKNKINVLLIRFRSKDKYVMKTKCGHRFHAACMIGWIENRPNCPMCRTKLDYFI